MILLIAEPGDMAALWLHAWLAKHGTAAVRIVTPAQLGYASSVAHYLGSPRDGIAFDLGPAGRLCSQDISGVVNRVMIAPQAHIERAPEADRLYASGELHAFMLGWLASLPCPMLNAPSPELLSGPHHSELATLHFAAIAGFECDADPPSAPQPATTHFILDGQVIGPLLNSAARDSMILFARAWNARLVQIETRPGAGGRRHFLSATSMADFPRGGALLARAILKALCP